MVEHNLAKVGVASSSLVSRSTKSLPLREAFSLLGSLIVPLKRASSSREMNQIKITSRSFERSQFYVNGEKSERELLRSNYANPFISIKRMKSEHRKSDNFLHVFNISRLSCIF